MSSKGLQQGVSPTNPYSRLKTSHLRVNPCPSRKRDAPLCQAHDGSPHRGCEKLNTRGLHLALRRSLAAWHTASRNRLRSRRMSARRLCSHALDANFSSSVLGLRCRGYRLLRSKTFDMICIRDTERGRITPLRSPHHTGPTWLTAPPSHGTPAGRSPWPGAPRLQLLLPL
jgi:hypothetical protein